MSANVFSCSSMRDPYGTADASNATEYSTLLGVRENDVKQRFVGGLKSEHGDGRVSEPLRDAPSFSTVDSPFSLRSFVLAALKSGTATSPKAIKPGRDSFTAKRRSAARGRTPLSRPTTHASRTALSANPASVKAVNTFPNIFTPYIPSCMFW